MNQNLQCFRHVMMENIQHANRGNSDGPTYQHSPNNTLFQNEKEGIGEKNNTGSKTTR